MTLQEWTDVYRAAKGRAERIRAMRGARMRAACREAGIGDYHGCVLHNALIAADQGRPWRNVDTAKLRLARNIERSLWEGDRLVSAWASRNRPQF